MNCRTTEKRQLIVNNYEVKLVAHIQLLAGQVKHSDAGQTIKDEYYIFEVFDHEGNIIDTIQCGLDAAKDFLRLINHNGLPLFNPLRSTIQNKHNSSLHNTTIKEKENDYWNPIAKQLYNAVVWLLIVWDAKPGTPLFNFYYAVDVAFYTSGLNY